MIKINIHAELSDALAKKVQAKVDSVGNKQLQQQTLYLLRKVLAGDRSRKYLGTPQYSGHAVSNWQVVIGDEAATVSTRARELRSEGKSKFRKLDRRVKRLGASLSSYGARVNDHIRAHGTGMHGVEELDSLKKRRDATRAKYDQAIAAREHAEDSLRLAGYSMDWDAKRNRKDRSVGGDSGEERETFQLVRKAAEGEHLDGLGTAVYNIAKAKLAAMSKRTRRVRLVNPTPYLQARLANPGSLRQANRPALNLVQAINDTKKNFKRYI